MKRELIGVSEAAKYLGMSVAWIYSHAETKHPRLPVIRFGNRLKFDPADLDQFVEEQRAASMRKRPSAA